MKNKLPFLILALAISLCSASLLHAQSIQSSPVNFTIKKLTANQSTNKLKMLIDMELTDAEASFITGIGVTSLCYCYCDSIWDAWPPPSDSFNIPGTATLYYMTSGNDGPNASFPGIPQNGVLGIKSVEGGIDRDTEFNVSLKFIVTD
jgi:hypothetical protein